MKNGLRIKSILVTGALALILAFSPLAFSTDKTEEDIGNVKNDSKTLDKIKEYVIHKML